MGENSAWELRRGPELYNLRNVRNMPSTTPMIVVTILMKNERSKNIITRFLVCVVQYPDPRGWTGTWGAERDSVTETVLFTSVVKRRLRRPIDNLML